MFRSFIRKFPRRAISVSGLPPRPRPIGRGKSSLQVEHDKHTKSWSFSADTLALGGLLVGVGGLVVGGIGLLFYSSLAILTAIDGRIGGQDCKIEGQDS